MKTLKRKNILLASMLLGTVALSTVGFSAWVITQGDSKVAEGTITVDTINDESHTISEPTFGSDELGDAEIKFGVKANTRKLDTTHTAWVGVDDNQETEDLTAVVTFTDANTNDAYFAANKLTVTLEAVTEQGKNGSYEAASGVKPASDTSEEVYNKYVGALPTLDNPETTNVNEGIVLSYAYANPTKPSEYGLTTVTATITFKWGDYFTATYVTTDDDPATQDKNEKETETVKGVNPLDHFNMLKGDSANAAVFKSDMSKLEARLAGVGYKLTITTAA